MRRRLTLRKVHSRLFLRGITQRYQRYAACASHAQPCAACLCLTAAKHRNDFNWMCRCCCRLGSGYRHLCNTHTYMDAFDQAGTPPFCSWLTPKSTPNLSHLLIYTQPLSLSVYPSKAEGEALSCCWHGSQGARPDICSTRALNIRDADWHIHPTWLALLK